MRFSSIEITNYRQYRHMRLEFPKGDHDLQVLIGDNGTGKTNLLNAFTWCLYGKEPHLGTDDARKGEPKLNKEALTEAYEKGVSKAEIRVTIEIEDKEDIVRIERVVPCSVLSETEIMELVFSRKFTFARISSDGESKVYSGDDAVNRVDWLLPEQIREYFFFDGEQLSNYFSDNRGDAIKSAIYSISQIDVITGVKDNLSSVLRDLRRNARNSAPDLDQFSASIKRLENERAAVSKIIERCDSSISGLTDKINELNERLRGVPEIAELEKKRADLSSKIKRALNDEQEKQIELACFAKDSYVEFAFYDVARSILNIIADLERNNQLPPSIDSAYLREMLQEHVCKVCKRPLEERDIIQIEQLLERQRVSSETSNILSGMRSELRRIVDQVETYPQRRKRVTDALNNSMSNRRQYEIEYNSNEAVLRNTPNSDEVKLWQNQRDEYQRLLSDSNIKKGSASERLIRINSQLEDEEKKQDDAIKKRDQLKELSDCILFATEAVSILKDAEKDIITSVREEMQARTEELFKGLVWKDSKCDHIELNDKFNLSLYDVAGFSCAGTCSAAERSLLALSFTLAMHQVSGFESPLYIDTPIARASGQNRANFAETLAEVSKSKQIILTFTPDEYSEAIASVFDPIAACRLEMKMDEERGISTIKGGC